MTIAKVVSTSLDNLGRKGTRQDNELTAIDGIIFSTSDFAPTIADLATESTWTDGIKEKTVFPLPGLDSYEDQSSEDVMYEAPSGNRKMLRRGKTRYMFQWDIPFSVHRSLQSYNNADLRIWIIRDGKICFYNDGGTARGFSINMFNTGRMKEVPADGSTPAFTPVYIDLANYREWDIYGETLEPSWEPADLEPLIDVTLEATTQTDASIVVKVYSADGYDEDGAVKEVAIKGIAEADFVLTDVGSLNAESGFVDNGDGTYTFTPAITFRSGSINLADPDDMTSTGLLIQSTGAVTITIGT